MARIGQLWDSTELAEDQALPLTGGFARWRWWDLNPRLLRCERHRRRSVTRLFAWSRCSAVVTASHGTPRMTAT